MYIYIDRERGRCTQQQMNFMLFSFVFVSVCLVEVLLLWVEVLLFVTMSGVGILSD